MKDEQTNERMNEPRLCQTPIMSPNLKFVNSMIFIFSIIFQIFNVKIQLKVETVETVEFV